MGLQLRVTAGLMLTPVWLNYFGDRKYRVGIAVIENVKALSD